MRRLLDRTRRRPKVTPLPKHHRTRAPEDGSSAGRRALRQTQVLVHATRYVAKRASYEGPLLVSHTFHEETVVRHEDERARPAVEQVLHESEHVGIEVVARLVQNQDIRFLQNGQQQRQTALLTTRKILDTTPHLLLRKSERSSSFSGSSPCPRPSRNACRGQAPREWCRPRRASTRRAAGTARQTGPWNQSSRVRGAA